MVGFLGVELVKNWTVDLIHHVGSGNFQSFFDFEDFVHLLCEIGNLGGVVDFDVLVIYQILNQVYSQQRVSLSLVPDEALKGLGNVKFEQSGFGFHKQERILIFGLIGFFVSEFLVQLSFTFVSGLFQ